MPGGLQWSRPGKGRGPSARFAADAFSRRGCGAMINITDSEKQGRDGAQSLDKFVECERRATSSSTCAARADNNLMRTMARRGRQEDVEYGSTATCSCAASDLNRPAVLGHNSTADP